MHLAVVGGMKQYAAPSLNHAANFCIPEGEDKCITSKCDKQQPVVVIHYDYIM